MRSIKRRTLSAPLVLLLLVLSNSVLHAQTGNIATIAGTGVGGTGGTGGPAVNAQVGNPIGIAIDGSDNLFVVDSGNNRVVRIDAVSGILTLVAGNGSASYGGDGGAAIYASINHPEGIAIDPAGNLYIAELASNRVRRVNAQSGMISTIAGNGTAGFAGDGGPAPLAALNTPVGVAVDAGGNLYIADTGNARIRRVDALSGVITTVAGNGAHGFTPDGAPALSAALSPPLDVSVDPAGNLLVYEAASGRIRRVDAVTGILTTFAGNGATTFTGDGVPATSAAIGQYLSNVAFDSAGNAFFADGTGRIRRVDTTGNIVTVAGNGSGAQGVVSAAAGGGGGGGPAYYCTSTVVGDNGPATVATIDGPAGVVITSNGNLVLSDWVDCRVRRVYLPSPNPYTNTVVSGSVSNVQPGQPVTYTATVSPIGAPGVPTGSVTFVDAPQFVTPTVLATMPLSGGVATFTTSSLSQGSHTIVGYYGGDLSFNGSGSPPVSLSVTQPAKPTPTVTLTAGQNPTTANTPTNFTVTVAPPAGSTTTPTGTAQIYDAGYVVATAQLANGVAQLSVSFSKSGTHYPNAYYWGDSNYSSAPSATITENVNAIATTTTLTTSGSPAAYGQQVIFEATVSPATATGNVQFLDNGNLVATSPLASGTAVIGISTLSGGSHSFIAVYQGDSADAGSSSSAVPQTITKTTPAITLTSNLNPALATLSVTFVASISPGSNGVNVQFLDGSTVLGTVAFSNPAVSFSTSSLSPGQHSITAVCLGDGNLNPVTSAVLTQTITAPTTLTVNSPGAQSTWGQPVTFTASITPAAATGAIQFSDGPTSIGSAPLSGGTASLTMPSLSVGNHPIQASYNGDGVYLSTSSSVWVQTVNKASTTISMVSSTNPATAGQAFSVTATVSPAAATGTVQFLNGSTVLGTGTVTNGVTTASISISAGGSYSLTAQYSGDANFAGSTSTAVSETVKNTTTTTLTADVNPSVYGQQVSFSVAISPVAVTGTVQLLDGSTVLNTVSINSGSVGFYIPSLGAGTHQITAVYSGDASNNGSTSAALTETVNKATATLGVVNSVLNPSVAGQSVTFQVAVLPFAATGTVQFLDGATVLGTVPLSNGGASFSTSALTAGSHGISTAYSGDSNYTTATSATLTQVVKAVSSTALTANPSSATAGQSVQLTASIAPATATGTVQFMDGANLLASVTVTNGTALIAASNLTVGSHSITAVYSGDAGDAGSASAAVAVTISKANSTTAVTSSLNPGTIGQPVTFSAAVAPSTATGTVQFLDGATVLGTATLSNGAAAFSTSSLSVGSHSITVVYSGDANDNASSSSALPETINKTNSATAVTSSLNPATIGQAVTFTATVTPGTATGTVQFLDGATVLGTATLSGGAASFNTSSLAAGSHSITAAYSGDANDNASSSSALPETINKTNSATAVTSSLNPATIGQAVTFTATVTPSAATGTVQFLDGATVIGTATLSGGTAAFSTSSLAAGSHSITASYTGNTNYNSSTSTAITQNVKATTTTTLSANNTSIAFGQAVQLTASVAPATATGTVQFLDGSTALGTVALSSGTASLTAANLAVGSHSLTAVYSGDGTDVASTSAALVVTVSKANSTTTVTSSLNPANAGQSVTFTATVTPASATGTVQFKDGSTVLGTVTLAGGSAAYATSSLATGSHSITAVYSGDGNDNTSTSGTLTETIHAALPGAPSNLTATAASSSQINLSWTASSTSGVTYNVYSSTTSGFTPSSANRIASGVSGTTYSNTGLAASSTHYYLVTAQNSAGESAATNQASATTQSSGGGCHVVYNVTTQWNVGFGTAITIQNTGSAAINGWTLSWTWPGNQQITQSWNANYTQTGANAALTNASWNASIPAGQTISGMGFNGSYSGSNPTPTAFYLNGTLCH